MIDPRIAKNPNINLPKFTYVIMAGDRVEFHGTLAKLRKSAVELKKRGFKNTSIYKKRNDDYDFVE